MNSAILLFVLLVALPTCLCLECFKCDTKTCASDKKMTCTSPDDTCMYEWKKVDSKDKYSHKCTTAKSCKTSKDNCKNKDCMTKCCTENLCNVSGSGVMKPVVMVTLLAPVFAVVGYLM